MPLLRLSGIETSDTTLDNIERVLGLDAYDVIDELEQAAYERLAALREEAQK